MQLRQLLNRYPHELSGGQQQRVALARALVIEPAVLLLDEPFGALDRRLREEMQVLLKDIQTRLRITTIMVTHDQEEALTMSDQVAVMNQGRIEQYGTPNEIYDRPTTRFVAGFIGRSNLIQGHIADRIDGMLRIESSLGTIMASGQANGRSEVTICLRPEAVKLAESPATNVSSDQCLGTIERVIYHGASTEFYIQTRTGQQLVATRASSENTDQIGVGSSVEAYWSPSAIRLLAG